MSGLQAIIFDLDDTLYPERDYVLSGFSSVAEWAQLHLGIEQGFNELEALFESGVRGDTFNRWLYFHHISDAVVPKLVQVYREHQPHLIPYPEIPALLACLHTKYQIGLVSDGHLAAQQLKLASLGIAPAFDAVVFSDEFGHHAWKPCTTPFKAVLQQLDCPASKAIYIGDNPKKDFFGARQTGLYTLWIKRKNGEYSNVEPPTKEHEPHFAISTFNDLERILNSV